MVFMALSQLVSTDLASALLLQSCIHQTVSSLILFDLAPCLA
ncbi:hypothetical protein Ptr902_08266 [Pyrenophora tritici-repentis]|uniref:Uncharacterized protein n=1 Tax=Pyrenophora tritici-repentis TaxID=45151 RepID=A0A5M9LFL8_9PLEO|nr:hypothetical protein PtrV1_05358 [Pyrenophora tritici-repentis]KAF7450100.1 hypothetical protein A1F99_047160 [Pyrenophora tritici-repentis]KAF7572671.1 hypothetical protein PtrM4_075760 [Pyrenophora tritici-repentis]KAI0574166.1 hypothetical protein Alg215_08753 [Pyrenophora tritici-repentis]KAI0592157.1 hypothetical protein Alg130_00609 [Pyrenophora tritici-repentis]